MPDPSALIGISDQRRTGRDLDDGGRDSDDRLGPRLSGVNHRGSGLAILGNHHQKDTGPMGNQQSPESPPRDPIALRASVSRR